MDTKWILGTDTYLFFPLLFRIENGSGSTNSYFYVLDFVNLRNLTPDPHWKILLE